MRSICGARLRGRSGAFGLLYPHRRRHHSLKWFITTSYDDKMAL